MWGRSHPDGYLCVFLSLFAGGIAGLICGVAATLTGAALHEGGLGKFLINTSKDNSILAGTIFSFGASVIGCVVVSFITHRIKSEQDEDHEWQKLYDIDNPLNPWEQNYKEELKGLHYDTKPTFQQMSSTFRKAKLTAYIGGGCSIALFAIVIPGIMASFPVMSQTQFSVWVIFTQVWAVVMAMIVIIAPPFEEIRRIMKQFKENKKRQKDYKNGATDHDEQALNEIHDKNHLDGSTDAVKL